MLHQLPEDEQLVLTEIADLIRREERFFITTHLGPDGDAIGSELALYLLLRKLGKEAVMVNADPVPAIYRFLPASADVVVWHPDLGWRMDGVLLVLDCGVLERIARVGTLRSTETRIVNIDHHPNNNRFGAVNWTAVPYAATGEMVYLLLKQFGPVDRAMADCIYTAILTDTGSFLYHFGRDTFGIVQELLELGIDPAAIAQKVYLERPLKSVRMLTRCLQTLRFDPVLKACWARISRELYRETGISEEDTEGIIDVLKTIEEADVVFLVKEKSKGIKFSFRGRNGYDVERLARHFGGGGHREAAGCFIEGVSAARAEELVFEQLRQYGRDYRRQ